MTDSPQSQTVIRAVARMQAGVLAVVCAVLGGAGLFGMTVWLLIKGGPTVGPHLGLLGQYYYGYTVSWPGAFVGLLYGALSGAVVGWSIATVYNYVASRRHDSAL